MSIVDRIERDLLGTLPVPADAYYGIQTARALRNFPISGYRLRPAMIRALGLVKKACAQANMEAGLLPDDVAQAIMQAAQEVADGAFNDQFLVDPIQGGAGTSINMNANEVIANRALEILGLPRGRYDVVHPNNHVNMSQSTNDVIPTAFRIALLDMLQPAVAALERLSASLAAKADQFARVLKVARTHLQDAVPIYLGQEFRAYARVVARHAARLRTAAEALCRVNLGGTAVGTGLNAPPQYAARAVELLREWTGYPLRQAEDLVDATQNVDDLVALSGALRDTAVSLSKIASDLRLMASGPRAGLGELRLPPVQPGSSIMPGKVNPVIPEVVNQVAFQLQGNDLVVSLAAQHGQLELNVMLPVVMHNLFESVHMLGNAARVFAEQCVDGIAANEEKLRHDAERCIGLATVLNLYIGYEAASFVATESLRTGKPIRDVVLEHRLLPEDVLDALLQPDNLTRGGTLPPVGPHADVRRTGAAGAERSSAEQAGAAGGAPEADGEP
ncbi:MAG: aspartate ammonia-lyase [Limnochordales bacterium]